VGGRSILVADRDEMTRTATVAILQRLGFEVVEADAGKTTLAQARARRYSCVILDLNLVENGAFELCRKLIAKSGWNWTPVIFTSLRHAQLELQMGMQSGGFAYLPKPFRADQLLSAVGDALASEGQMRQARPNRKLLLDRAEAAIAR
jgi:two-component system alkaline phosphatase synthesis response regulator PhoP/two-component system response regulator VicR